MTARRRNIRLRTDDERRLAKLTADIDAANDSCDGAVAEVNRFVDDVDSDRIVLGGVVETEHHDEDHGFVTRVCPGSTR